MLEILREVFTDWKAFFKESTDLVSNLGASTHLCDKSGTKILESEFEPSAVEWEDMAGILQKS